MIMNMDRAVEILGINNTKGPLQNMMRALSIHAWGNTQDENDRLLAAQYILPRWKAYSAECNRRRNRCSRVI
ncbi:MAG: hypothetical protein EOR25_15630 [Mesorhizobium sp.]|uniref:hypothetical protein n=2 Tax=Mesorhizobium sp. TaxID=1871066 RepID=UPI000FE37F25|nr:hypothetical protein [Mesorhizobium sp.]RWI88214.1 MAG: hypothetical protein EOR20_04015 [Mesorhizobium sp.]RWJ09646.1 MAG: hypothetical protein EOR24_18340 [Mesorhizobium sp.]RWJ16321.1 MAG: hypothetical protein EOR25_15630 [Mesorhizobium sp.]RWJ56825.1 MAG: hypothetical protein EOR32_33295 [Mesorhizobium sp.]TIQ64397.1 MAG: hypothetical protein E5X41_17200 [Mesorhizobium sp.]